MYCFVLNILIFSHIDLVVLFLSLWKKKRVPNCEIRIVTVVADESFEMALR